MGCDAPFILLQGDEPAGTPRAPPEHFGRVRLAPRGPYEFHRGTREVRRLCYEVLECHFLRFLREIKIRCRESSSLFIEREVVRPFARVAVGLSLLAGVYYDQPAAERKYVARGVGVIENFPEHF